MARIMRRGEAIQGMLSRYAGLCRTLWTMRALISRGPHYEELCEGYSEFDMETFALNAYTCVAMLFDLYLRER